MKLQLLFDIPEPGQWSSSVGADIPGPGICISAEKDESLRDLSMRCAVGRGPCVWDDALWVAGCRDILGGELVEYLIGLDMPVAVTVSGSEQAVKRGTFATPWPNRFPEGWA